MHTANERSDRLNITHTHTHKPNVEYKTLSAGAYSMSLAENTIKRILRLTKLNKYGLYGLRTPVTHNTTHANSKTKIMKSIKEKWLLYVFPRKKKN